MLTVSPRAKLPSMRDDAGRQQALAAAQRLLGAGVDDEAADRLERAGDPALARLAAGLPGRETRCSGRPRLDARARGAARGRRRSPCRQPAAKWRCCAGLDLGHHAARPEPGQRPPGHRLDLRRDLAHLRDAAAPRGCRAGPCRARRHRRAAPGSRPTSSPPPGRPAGHCRHSGSRRSPPCRSR